MTKAYDEVLESSWKEVEKEVQVRGFLGIPITEIKKERVMVVDQSKNKLFFNIFKQEFGSSARITEFTLDNEIIIEFVVVPKR